MNVKFRNIVLSFFAFTNLFSSATLGNVIINEIMYNPNQCNDYDCEWIELFNPEDYEINLSGWMINGKPLEPVNISAKSFLVVARQLIDVDGDGQSFEAFWGNNDTVWNSSDGDYIAIDGNFVLTNPKDTNSNDTINLTNGTYWDAVTYSSSWGANGTGFTLERVDPYGPTNSSDNWKPSKNVNGTPGRRNSVTPFDHDLAVENITFDPVDPSPRTGVNISVIIQNKGLFNETNVNISFYNNSDIFHSQLINVTKQSNTTIKIKWNNTKLGNSTILVKLENFTDDFTANNNATKNITFAFHLIINEIMYNPPKEIGSDTDYEWIEIYNNATYAENLTNWSLKCDNKLISLEGILPSGGYLVLAKDPAEFYKYYSSSIPTQKQTCSLNNEGDTIQLVFNNSIIYYYEEFSYSPSLGADGTGYSLEKINPVSDNNNNWAESKVYGGTPGMKNNPDTKIKESLAKTTVVTKVSTSTQIIYVNASEDYRIISFPEKVYVNEPFVTTVRLSSSKEEFVSLYSYVYDGKKLLSEGFDGNNWKSSWTANKVEVKINSSPTYVNLENKIKPDTLPGKYTFKVRIKDKIDLVREIEILPERKDEINLSKTADNRSKTADYVNIECQQTNDKGKITINVSDMQKILLLHFSQEATKNETLDVIWNSTYEIDLDAGYNSIILLKDNEIIKKCEFFKSSRITGRTTQVTIDNILQTVKNWFKKINFLNIFTKI